MTVQVRQHKIRMPVTQISTDKLLSVHVGMVSCELKLTENLVVTTGHYCQLRTQAIEDVEQRCHGGPVSGIAAGIGIADNAAGIHDKVTPELAAVTLAERAAPGPAPGHEFDVGPDRSWAPRTNQRPFQSERAIGDPRRVEPQLKWHLRFLEPGSRQQLGAEGNDDGPRAAAREAVPAAAQLCHMLAAGQSTQVPQKDEQRRLTRMPGLGQWDELPIQGRQSYFRSGLADLQCHGYWPAQALLATSRA